MVQLLAFCALASVQPSITPNVTQPWLASELLFQLPRGWSSEVQEGIRVLKPGNVKEGTAFTVMVPPLTKKVGSMGGLIEEGKKLMAEVGKFTPLSEPAKGKTDADWDFELLLGSVEVGGARILGEIVCFRKGDAGEGVILAIAESAETMERHSSEFSALIRSVGLSGKVAPNVATSGTAMKFSLPPGWGANAVQGTTMLEKWENKDDDFYGSKRLFRLFVGSSEPLKGTLRSMFVAKWNTEIKPYYGTKIVPLPMMRRLKSGLACAFDGDDQATTKEGVKLHCNLYLIAQGDRVVPIIATFIPTFSPGLEKDLIAIFESARIPGAADKKAALFESSDVVGDWSTSSASIATYVTSSGGYAGDATVASGQALKLNANGSFESWIGGVGRGIIVRESNKGSWKILDTVLVLEGKSKQNYQLFGAGKDPSIGTFLILSMLPDTGEVPEFGYPRRPLAGTWLKRKN